MGGIAKQRLILPIKVPADGKDNNPWLPCWTDVDVVDNAAVIIVDKELRRPCCAADKEPKFPTKNIFDLLKTRNEFCRKEFDKIIVLIILKTVKIN